MFTLASLRKFMAALAGVAGQAVAAGLLHGTALHWTQIALAAATALGVYAAPNAAPAEDDWTATDKPAPSPRGPEDVMDGDTTPATP